MTQRSKKISPSEIDYPKRIDAASVAENATYRDHLQLVIFLPSWQVLFLAERCRRRSRQGSGVRSCSAYAHRAVKAHLMQRERKSHSRRGVWYCACAAAVIGAIWLFSGLFKRQPRSLEVWSSHRKNMSAAACVQCFAIVELRELLCPLS